MKNFRQILSGINPEPLLAQIAAHPRLWNSDDAWTRKKYGSAIYNEDNIVLRHITLGMIGQTLTLYEEDNPRTIWNRLAFSLLPAAQDIIFDLMRSARGEHLGKIILTRMRPGQVIGEHIDNWPPQAGPPYWQRYQIPLSVAPGVIFKCGNEELYMEPGRAYWFDNQKTHSVVNHSTEDRISMLADIRPFVAL